MIRLALALLSCLLWAGTASAQASSAARLQEAVVASCGVIVGVTIGAEGVPASVVIHPANQQACAQATIDAFDWSGGAQTAWENLRFRTAAKALYATTEQLGKALRCFADVVKDEINILRAEVVGVQTASWDPAAIANGAGLTSPNVTVSGAAFGDQVLVAAPYSLQGLTATGSVVSANTVVLRLENQTGGSVNLASGTWTGVVVRLAAKNPRTNSQLRNQIDACIDGGAQD